MNARDDVFALVKALTASEKRFFTLHARRHASDPHYVRLFEVLESMEVYDEQAVIKAFAGSPAQKHLAVVRHTLMEEIIEAMTKWSSGSTPDDVVQREYEAVRFLYDKGCRVACERHLKKALQLAEEHELPVRILELCSWQRRISPNDARARRSIAEMEERAVRMLGELHSTHAESGGTVAGPLLSTVADLRRRHRAMCQQHAGEERTSASERRMDVIRKLAASPHLHRAHAREWCEMLLDVITQASLASDVACLRATRDVVVMLQVAEHPLAIRRLLAAVHTFVAVAIELHTEITPASAAYHIDRSLLSPTMDVLWSIHRAAILTALGNEQCALQIINDVLNNANLRVDQPAWYGQALILNVVIHLALGNTEYVPYCIRSAQRKNDARLLFTSSELVLLRRLPVVDPTAASTSPLKNVLAAWERSLDGRVQLELHRTRVGAA